MKLHVFALAFLFGLFARALPASGTPACENEASGWVRFLTSTLRTALEVRAVEQQQIAALVNGDSWFNPMQWNPKDINNLSLKNGIDRALHNIHREDRPKARTAIRSMLLSRSEEQGGTVAAMRQTQTVLAPRIIRHYEPEMDDFVYRGQSLSGWLEGRPIYTSRVSNNDFDPMTNRIHNDSTNTILLDPLNPNPEKTFRFVSKRNQYSPESTLLERDGTTYLVVARYGEAYDLKTGKPVPWESLGIEIPGEDFRSSRRGYHFADLPDGKYIAVKHGPDESGLVYRFNDSKPEIILQTPSLSKPKFVRAGGVNFIFQHRKGEIYARALQKNSTDIVIKRTESKWRFGETTIYEDQGRFYVLYRSVNSDKKWKIVRKDLQTLEEEHVNQREPYKGSWSVLKIQGIPHAYFVRAGKVIVLNLRTMEEVLIGESHTGVVTDFEVNGVQYILAGANIYDVQTGQLAGQVPGVTRVIYSHVSRLNGELYAILIGSRSPAVFVQLTREETK